MKTHESLPTALQYLQPFVRSPAKLPPEELNEDLDASRLDAALRKRLRGLDENAATAALSQDRKLLEEWLKTSAAPDHPAYWVLGYLSLPDVAEHLTRPPEPLSQGPKISFDPPNGWKVKVVPFRLDLKCGRLWAEMTASDPFMNAILLRQQEHWSAQPTLEATLEMTPVTFGSVSGTKIVILQTAPFKGKSVRYLLTVPGGGMRVDIGAAKDADFDETPLEMQLHTLVIAPQD